MDKFSLQSFGKFVGFVAASTQDEGDYQQGYGIPALFVLILWIFVNAWLMQQVYHRLGMLQTVMNTFQTDPQLTFQELKEKDAFAWKKEEKGFWSSLFGSNDDEKKMSPFWQAAIAGSFTVLIMFLFLTLMGKSAKSETGAGDALVATGATSVPMMLGMVASYGMFRLAESFSGENIPSLLYLLGVILMAIGAMSSLIVLFVDTHKVLSMEKRKRYFTTIFTVLIAAGTFTCISRWLIS